MKFREGKIEFVNNKPYVQFFGNKAMIALPQNIIDYIEDGILIEGSDVLSINNQDIIPFIRGGKFDLDRIPLLENKYYFKSVLTPEFLFHYSLNTNEAMNKYSWANLGRLENGSEFDSFEEALSDGYAKTQRLYMFNSAKQLFGFYSQL